VVELEKLRVSIRTGQTVRRLEFPNPGEVRVITDSERFSAGKVVICAGAWSGHLLKSLQPCPHIHPVRGQMLLFHARPGLIRHMMLEDNRYIIPRRDGRVLFGSTLEETGFDKATTDEARRELHRLATARFPALADYPLEAHWAGLRPFAPAGIPYIGVHPRHERLFVNTGHFRNGVVLSPASARLMADLVLGRRPILDPAPYALEAPRDEPRA
ncbi:MAG TPA: FAD-dependent oxidoreductase, partial [Chromatiaceae bacterium]|nr:FAD-dependent oxidoreductase [Chromatiaceae bacterium]